MRFSFAPVSSSRAHNITARPPRRVRRKCNHTGLKYLFVYTVLRSATSTRVRRIKAVVNRNVKFLPTPVYTQSRALLKCVAEPAGPSVDDTKIYNIPRNKRLVICVRSS